MRVFITGASGFIGRTLCERYAADGHEVRGVDLAADPGRQVVAGDVAQSGAWQDWAADSELVIHTAATVSLRLERRDEIWRSNVLGTANAIDAAERAGARRFVHFSSVTVFGLEFPDGVDERYPVRNSFIPYPDSKIASEQVTLQAHLDGRVQCTVVRPGDVYGPRSRAWATVPAELIRQRRFMLPGLGRGIHSPVYIDNLVDGVVLAANSPDAAGQVFTLSDGIGVPYREFFAPYAELIGRRLVLMPTPVALGAAAVAQRLARLQRGDNEVNPASARYLLRRGTYSIEKARKVLGWEPRVGLRVGLERTVGWLNEQGFGAR
ncbi:MAG TPA: NAD-dependent epimerase/dehydratase family protein [Solirubrobacteraceae bacterium]|nr:NAD-dependent epimerase/dehydratase family protein [Solirubrobacteraceae bacterium]